MTPREGQTYSKNDLVDDGSRWWVSLEDANSNPLVAGSYWRVTLQGDTGPTGVGTKGDKGDKGDAGGQGAIGHDGPQGPPGEFPSPPTLTTGVEYGLAATLDGLNNTRWNWRRIVNRIRTMLDYDDSTAPTNGQVIAWNSSSNKWKPITNISSGPAYRGTWSSAFTGGYGLDDIVWSDGKIWHSKAANNTASLSDTTKWEAASSLSSGGPSVTLSSSSSNVTTAGDITLIAVPANITGVARVEFYRGTTLVGTSYSSPYERVVTFIATENSTLSFTAKAFDASNVMTTSNTVDVVVNISASHTGLPPSNVIGSYMAANFLTAAPHAGEHVWPNTVANGLDFHDVGVNLTTLISSHPPLNNRPAVQFSGYGMEVSGSYLGISSHPEVTIFAVIDAGSQGTGYGVIVSYDSAMASNRFMIYKNDSVVTDADKVVLKNLNSDGTAPYFSAAVTTNTITAASLIAVIDRNLTAKTALYESQNTTPSVDNLQTNTDAVTSFDGAVMRLGGQGNNANNQGFTGYIAEIHFYQGAATPADVTRWNNYVQATYGAI